MSDVRLTATNPDDSSVVPVACNAKGELKLEEVPTFDGNLDGDLTVSGGGEFGDQITTPQIVVSGTVKSDIYDNGVGYSLYRGDDWGGIYFKAVSASGLYADAAYPLRASFDGLENVVITSSGKAYFASDVIVGSRNAVWKIVESGGIAHLIQETDFLANDPADVTAVDQVNETEDVYPQLRNLPRELDLIEQALGEVMEKLRMVPPAGWPIWDGSDENS
jgi:hypothetical protein